MYTDNVEINGQKVTISVAIEDLKQKYNKCARCSQYLDSVDKDPLFQMVCERCSSVLHTFLYDIYYGYNNHWLPPALRTMSSTDFINIFVRKDLRSLSFEELQKM